MKNRDQAKQEAEKLFNEFFKHAGDIHLSKNENTKNIVILLCDKIIEFSEELGKELYSNATDSYQSRCINSNYRDFYKEVKKQVRFLKNTNQSTNPFGDNNHKTQNE